MESFTTVEPAKGIKQRKNILAIGAHPDDIEFGCSGTLLLAKAQGHSISTILCTYGDGVRIAEQRESDNLLGQEPALHYGLTDTEINVGQLRDLLEDYQRKAQYPYPDVVMTHYPDDSHQDHRAVAGAVKAAFRNHPRVLFFQSFSSLNFRPTLYTSVRSYMAKKQELIECHRSQLNVCRDMATLSEHMGAYHAMNAKMITGSEAFFTYHYLLEL